jgi:pimeloyl-ACP methyl ester carboxylesterase
MIFSTRRFVMAATLFIAATSPVFAQAPANPTIVLVHGAWVNGSGWRPVYERLVKDGYHVVIAEHPLTSFNDDTTAVKRTLALQSGPVVLVGHSYGGAIITNVGNDPKVKALVYIAAHALDEGETEVANGKKYPNVAGPDVRKTADGFLYLEPSKYPADFAADLDPATARFEADAQELTAASVFASPATHPAWKDKPSWYMVAGGDKIINPDLERMYAKRAHSTTVEVPGASHSVYQSHPVEVADLIEKAAVAVAATP